MSVARRPSACPACGMVAKQLYEVVQCVSRSLLRVLSILSLPWAVALQWSRLRVFEFVSPSGRMSRGRPSRHRGVAEMV